MISRLISAKGHPSQILPPGLHYLSFREFREIFAFNDHRFWIFDGLKAACQELRAAGCLRIYIGGSYVTSKIHPSDYDACWDPVGVSGGLDPILYANDLHTERRQKYRGDLLIGGADDGPSGEHFRFLSRDKLSGEERGMVGIKLNMLELLNS